MSMYVLSKIKQLKTLLSSVTSILVLSAIIMELLPEDEAKIFVIPTLIAALFMGVGQTYLYRRS